MDIHLRAVCILFNIFFLILSTSFVAVAQPLGILSSQGKQESQKQILSSSEGRFVFGQISDSSKDQFMLDTRTGRLWRISERGDIGIFLSNVPYCIAEGKYSHLPEKIGDTQAKE
jgi:hypothetical protein